MKHQAPRAIADLLDAALPQLGERLLCLRVARGWSALVGADMARRARPRAVTAGTLDVVVDNSPWLHELTLRAPDLTRAVRERFPAIVSLRFSLGALPADARDAGARERPRRRALTDGERREIDEAAAAIPDPALAAAARRLMTRARRSTFDARMEGAGAAPARREE
jgi:hypothetical protein